MEIRFGDVMQVDFGVTTGSIQGNVRPCVVIQNDAGNKFSPTTIVVPLTSEIKKVNMPVHDILYKSAQNGLKSNSLILGEQVRVIDKSMILYKLGTLNDEECDKVIGVYLRNVPRRKNRRMASYGA